MIDDDDAPETTGDALQEAGSADDESRRGPPEPTADGAPVFDRREGGDAARHRRAVFGVPVQVIVSVGNATPTIGDLLKMRRDALLPLNTKVEDPVEIMIGKRVIARGELQEMEDSEGRLGVRLTEIVDLNNPF